MHQDAPGSEARTLYPETMSDTDRDRDVGRWDAPCFVYPGPQQMHGPRSCMETPGRFQSLWSAGNLQGIDTHSGWFWSGFN